LNATTEKQRKGIADYFSPTIAINRVSGGGEGSLGGDSVFSENTLAMNGTGATMQRPTEANKARGSMDGADEDIDSVSPEIQDRNFEEMERILMGRGGESLLEENELKHIITRVTDEGLVIELFDTPEQALFETNSTEPTPMLREIARVVQGVSKAVINSVAVEGHVSAEPIVVAESTIWGLSSARADRMRVLLTDSGMRDGRIQRVTGYADREPSVNDPMAVRNNRLEVILLR